MKSNIELLKMDFREFCVNYLSKQKIHKIFASAGIQEGTSEKNLNGERRPIVENYYASLDWENTESIRKFAKVLETTLLMTLDWNEGDINLELRSLCEKHGFSVDEDGYRFYVNTYGVGDNVKNLIFASSGPKPEIVFSDAVSNNIEIVENADFCLVYSRPIKSHGLLWQELVDWWREKEHLDEDSDRDVGVKLYRRLHDSLNSPPEKIFFHTYFKKFHEKFKDKLPALIPQVYLHYDPYTIKQLQNQHRLMRQRMDFLLLLSNHTRIVIEIDGKQHYAEGDKASPRLYSEMVAEDRKLKLSGYEVYRFGGYEINEKETNIVEIFVNSLFQRHNVCD